MTTIAIADSYEFAPRQIVYGAADGERYEVLMMWGTDDIFTYAVSLDSDTRVTNPDFRIRLTAQPLKPPSGATRPAPHTHRYRMRETTDA